MTHQSHVLHCFQLLIVAYKLVGIAHSSKVLSLFNDNQAGLTSAKSGTMNEEEKKKKKKQLQRRLERQEERRRNPAIFMDNHRKKATPRLNKRQPDITAILQPPPAAPTSAMSATQPNGQAQSDQPHSDSAAQSGPEAQSKPKEQGQGGQPQQSGWGQNLALPGKPLGQSFPYASKKAEPTTEQQSMIPAFSLYSLFFHDDTNG